MASLSRYLVHIYIYLQLRMNVQSYWTLPRDKLNSCSLMDRFSLAPLPYTPVMSGWFLMEHDSESVQLISPGQESHLFVFKVRSLGQFRS